MKKVLLLGGTGALGIYLTKELLDMGYKVDVVAKDQPVTKHPNLTFYLQNAKDKEFQRTLLQNRYDAIVDFLIYSTMEEYDEYYPNYLANTHHYLYLSSYRVYGDAKGLVTEETPRLIDLPLPSDFVREDEYSIYKAEGEDRLKNSGKKNWTILRPAISFSQRRYQLTVLEARHFYHRMLKGKVVPLPECALDVQGTLSWAGDFGKTVARLILNPYAYGEAYTVGTAEHHSWREIAEMYGRIAGLKYQAVSADAFFSFRGDDALHRQQLFYDRCFNRALDNSKLLNATGLKQSDFMPTEKGLAYELGRQNPDEIPFDIQLDQKMDAIL